MTSDDGGKRCILDKIRAKVYYNRDLIPIANTFNVEAPIRLTMKEIECRGCGYRMKEEDFKRLLKVCPRCGYKDKNIS